MKTRNSTHQKLIATATAGIPKKSLGAVPHSLLACSLLLSACFQDPSSESGSDSDGAVIEGQVIGEAGLAKRGTAAGLEGATVTVVRLKADGSFETVSEGPVRTDGQGRFSIESSVEAAAGLMVVARKEAEEFKAVISGEVKKGAKTPCRPLDVESTIEAEVWSKVQADGRSGSVSFADVASHVDAEVAAKAEGNSEVKAFLASQLETEAEIRGSVLIASGKATRAMIERMDEGRIKAQASLEAALHAAARTGTGVSAEVKAKVEGDYVKAHWSAVSGAGIALGEFAKAREAAFQAMIKSQADASIAEAAKLAWLKRIALHNAWSLEAALSEDVKAVGGDAGLVAEAGAALELELQSATSGSEIDSAFAKCRRTLSLGIESALEGALTGSIGLPDSSKARAALELSLDSALTTEAVAEAYTRFYADAGAEIEAGFSGSLEAAKLQAATRAALLINLQGPASIGGDDSLRVSLLAAMEAAAKAQSRFLTDSGVSLSQAGLLLIATARAAAQGKLEAGLEAAGGEPDKIEAAYDAYQDALMEAYVNAGLDASVYARSTQVYAQAMAKASMGLSLETKIGVVRSAHSQAARGLRSALEIQMKAAGASEVVLEAAVAAGVALQAAIDASSRIETITAAYGSYHASITAALSGIFFQHAAAISTADGRIRSEGGARADLMAAIQAEWASEGITKAHADFAAEVEAEVREAFKGGLNQPTAAQIEVIGQVLFLANMCG